MPRRFPIFQFPNLELLTAMSAGALAQASRGDLARGATLISRVALMAWAAEELFGGANWFRRLLGAGGAAYALGLLPRPGIESEKAP
jgi:hypothetical protein